MIFHWIEIGHNMLYNSKKGIGIQERQRQVLYLGILIEDITNLGNYKIKHLRQV